MAAPTGLHLRGPAVTSVQVYVEVCVCTHEGCHSISYISISTSTLCVCTHSPLCVLRCVCVCVCIMTVILYDRMITLFSPQLRGVSLLRSSPPHPSLTQRSYVLPHMSKPVSLWAATLLCILFSLLSACPHNLRSLSDTKQLNQQKSCTAEHTDPMT